MRLLFVAFLAFAACDVGASGEPRGAGDARVESVRALCRARDASRQDISRARDIFLDESHDPLHEIASSVAEKDPAIAARLLEAKQQIESDLEGHPSPRVETHFETLIEAANRALNRMGYAEELCP